jgi:hypothetical protein
MVRGNSGSSALRCTWMAFLHAVRMRGGFRYVQSRCSATFVRHLLVHAADSTGTCFDQTKFWMPDPRVLGRARGIRGIVYRDSSGCCGVVDGRGR